MKHIVSTCSKVKKFSRNDLKFKKLTVFPSALCDLLRAPAPQALSPSRVSSLSSSISLSLYLSIFTLLMTPHSSATPPFIISLSLSFSLSPLSLSLYIHSKLEYCYCPPPLSIFISPLSLPSPFSLFSLRLNSNTHIGITLLLTGRRRKYRIMEE